MRDSRPAAVAAAGLVVALALGWLSNRAAGPPRPAPAEAASELFSAARALATVEAIARRPRPMGTVAHAEARDYLRGRFDEIGFETRVEESTVLVPRRGRLRGARVSNLLARLPGSGRHGAILLMAHYDSVPGSPGAGDDAVGVAAIVEAARALAAGPRLERDVLVLITDGEEAGLLGARAFVEDEERLSTVALMLNFEARGSHGVVHMFETSAGNHRLVEEMERAAPRPVASSLSYEVYRRMPNDTDFSVLRRAGVAGLNFAMIGGYGSYHTRLDNIERLDPGSLQHHGSYALSLARHFASLEELPAARADGVYFNGFGGRLFFSYSSNTARLCSTLLIALAAVGLTVRSRRHRGRVAGVGWGTLLFAAAAIAGLAAATAVWRALLLLAPTLRLAPHGVPWISGWLAVAGALLTLALVAALVRMLSMLAEAVDLWAGALVAWTLLAVATSFFLPGASYVFQWPAAAGWLGLLAVERLAGSRRWRVVVATLAALPAVVLLAPVLRLLLEALTVRQAGPAHLVLGLVATLFAVPLAEITSWGRNWVEAGLGTIALAVLGAAVLAATPSAAAPATSHLFYALDAERGEASWMSTDRLPDEWTVGWLGEAARPESVAKLLPFLRSEVLRAPAPVVELKAPTVSIERAVDRPERLSLRLVSTRGASSLWLQIESDEPLRLLRVDGREPEAGPVSTGGDEALVLWFLGLPAEGIEVEVESRGGRIELGLCDQTYGMPEVPGGSPRRPLERIPPASWISDSVLVARRVVWMDPETGLVPAAEKPAAEDGSV